MTKDMLKQRSMWRWCTSFSNPHGEMMLSCLIARKECTLFQKEFERSITTENTSMYLDLISVSLAHSVRHWYCKLEPQNPASSLQHRTQKQSVCAKNIAEIREVASSQFGRDSSNIKVLALVTPILGRTEEEAQAKLADYRKYASLEGALALFCGWTGIDLGKYGDDEELRQVESNAVRSTVEGYARFSPGTSKWTKHTVAEHVSIGGNGPIFVGTPSQVVDGFQTWIDEADVDGFNIVSCAPNVGRGSINAYTGIRTVSTIV
jgi:hypothetical protein